VLAALCGSRVTVARELQQARDDEGDESQHEVPDLVASAFAPRNGAAGGLQVSVLTQSSRAAGYETTSATEHSYACHTQGQLGQ
jgi:hypothetical protein